jgi:ABC-type Fe3+ transport system permease subunit
MHPAIFYIPTAVFRALASDEARERYKRSIRSEQKEFSKKYLSSTTMITLVMAFEYGLYNLIQNFVWNGLNEWVYGGSAVHLIIILLILSLPAYIIDYFLSSKNDIYLKYFKEFDELQIDKRKKYFWYCFIVAVAIILFMVGSFLFYPVV